MIHTGNANNIQGIDQVIDLLEQNVFSADIVCSWTQPSRAPKFDGFPDGLEAIIQKYLQYSFPNGLFKHQADAIRTVQRGRNVLITTGTSSGKSLCYQIPILNEVVKDTSSTAIMLFPTKALAEDQLKKLNGMISSFEKPIPENLRAANYDGDTPRGKRIPIRNQARIILTNPDMLHIGILPQHTNWERVLRNIKFIVIDEVHSYRGVFGSHFANVLRRLKRILRFYDCFPQFILTSATISNADEFAGKLTGEDFEIINTDTSYQEGRRYFFVNPPIVDESLGLRKGMIDQTLEIASVVLSYNVQSLLFCRTRKTVEITLKRLNDAFCQ